MPNKRVSKWVADRQITIDDVITMVGQEPRRCECGQSLPPGETYCRVCRDTFEDRYQTERAQALNDVE